MQFHSVRDRAHLPRNTFKKECKMEHGWFFRIAILLSVG